MLHDVVLNVIKNGYLKSRADFNKPNCSLITELIVCW